MTDPTGITVTRSTAVPVLPSTDAEMVAWPTASAFTIPVGLTVATAVLSESQVGDRPATTAFVVLRTVATAWVLSPT